MLVEGKEVVFSLWDTAGRLLYCAKPLLGAHLFPKVRRHMQGLGLYHTKKQTFSCCAFRSLPKPPMATSQILGCPRYFFFSPLSCTILTCITVETSLPQDPHHPCRNKNRFAKGARRNRNPRRGPTLGKDDQGVEVYGVLCFDTSWPEGSLRCCHYLNSLQPETNGRRWS